MQYMDYLEINFPAYRKLLEIFKGMEPSIQRCLAMLKDIDNDGYESIFPGLFKSDNLSEKTFLKINELLDKYKSDFAIRTAEDKLNDAKQKVKIDGIFDGEPESLDTLKKIAEKKGKLNREIKIEDGDNSKDDTTEKQENPIGLSSSLEESPEVSTENSTIVDDKTLNAIRNNLHKLIPEFKDDDISEHVLRCLCLKTLLKDNMHPINLRYDLVAGTIVDKIKTCRLPESIKEKSYVYSYLIPALLLYLHRVDNNRYHEWLRFPDIEKFGELEGVFEEIPSPIKSGFDVSDYIEYDFSSRCYRFRTITENGGSFSFVEDGRKKMVFDNIRKSIRETGVEQEKEMDDEFLDKLLSVLGVNDNGETLYESVNKSYRNLKSRLESQNKVSDKLSHFAYIIPCMTHRIYRHYSSIPVFAYLFPSEFIDIYMDATYNLTEIDKDFNEDFDTSFNFTANENRQVDKKLTITKVSPKICDAIRAGAGLDSGSLTDIDINMILATVISAKNKNSALEDIVANVSRNTNCTENTEEFYKRLLLKLFDAIPKERLDSWLSDTRYAGAHNKARSLANLLTLYAGDAGKGDNKELRTAIENIRRTYGFSTVQLPYDVMKEFFDMVFSGSNEHSDLIDYCCKTPGEFLPEEIVPYENMDSDDFCMFLEHLFELLSFSVLHFWLNHSEGDCHWRALILLDHAQMAIFDLGVAELTKRQGKPSDIHEDVNNPLQLPNDSFGHILGELAELHEKKNKDYGDAAHKAYERHGIDYYLIMLEQKLLRASNLNKTKDSILNFESMEDSLLDLANYAIMSVDSLRRDSRNPSDE